MSQAAIDVYLVAGFLGSGKTTFLNRLLGQVPQGVKFMVLMNEFGEEGIDGVLIDDTELELVEISRGSIFCSCVKGDYIKALYRIAFTLEPQVLLIEASGVANPESMDKDMAIPVFQGRFNLRAKICLIDAANFLEHLATFNAVQEQIAASDLFIINKTDLSDAATLAKIKQVIAEANPGAKFMETTYAQVDLKALLADWGAPEGQEAGPAPEELLDEAGLDQVVDRILDTGALSLKPPDALMSITCRWRGGGLERFRAVAQAIPGDVVRGKGFIHDNGQVYLYSHVGRDFTLEPYHKPVGGEEGLNRVVFIRASFDQDDLTALFEAQGLDLITETMTGPC